MDLIELQEKVANLCDGLYLLELKPSEDDRVLLENLKREASELCSMVDDFVEQVAKKRGEEKHG